MTEPESIFENLKSQLIAAHEERNEKIKWSWSVCAKPIQIEETLIMGINWGGGGATDNYEYKYQEKMPSFEEFESQYKARNRECKVFEEIFSGQFSMW